MGRQKCTFVWRSNAQCAAPRCSLDEALEAACAPSHSLVEDGLKAFSPPSTADRAISPSVSRRRLLYTAPFPCPDRNAGVPGKMAEQCVFAAALDAFKRTAGLTRAEAAEFQIGSLNELETTIRSIQDKQERSREMMYMKRLEPFLESMKQYGKVIEVFSNTSEILAWVWVSSCSPARPGAVTTETRPNPSCKLRAPMKFILLVSYGTVPYASSG